jgi:hypothetical protein
MHSVAVMHAQCCCDAHGRLVASIERGSLQRTNMRSRQTLIARCSCCFIEPSHIDLYHRQHVRVQRVAKRSEVRCTSALLPQRSFKSIHDSTHSAALAAAIDSAYARVGGCLVGRASPKTRKHQTAFAHCRSIVRPCDHRQCLLDSPPSQWTTYPRNVQSNENASSPSLHRYRHINPSQPFPLSPASALHDSV